MPRGGGIHRRKATRMTFEDQIGFEGLPTAPEGRQFPEFLRQTPPCSRHSSVEGNRLGPAASNRNVRVFDPIASRILCPQGRNNLAQGQRSAALGIRFYESASALKGPHKNGETRGPAETLSVRRTLLRPIGVDDHFRLTGNPVRRSARPGLVDVPALRA